MGLLQEQNQHLRLKQTLDRLLLDQYLQEPSQHHLPGPNHLVDLQLYQKIPKLQMLQKIMKMNRGREMKQKIQLQITMKIRKETILVLK